jgi:hypothetical protein
VRAAGWAAFTALVAAFVAVMTFAGYATWINADKDPPDAATRKAECRELAVHFVAISDQSHGSPEEIAAKLPIEDIEQCAAADKDKQGNNRKPEVLACARDATSVDALKKCLPPRE